MRYVFGVCLLSMLATAYTYGSDSSAEGSLKPEAAKPMEVPSVWEEVSTGVQRAGVNENRGNWFLKSQILKKAIKPVKEVQRVVKEIVPYQKVFTDRLQTFKADLGAFYQDYGFQEADVVAQRAIVTAEIASNEQRLRQPVLPVKKEERPTDKSQIKRPLPPPLPNPADEIKRLKINQADIEKLAKLMVRVRSIEAAADESVGVVINSIKGARDFETGAWRDYEKIADTLSDVVAEDKYRAIEAALTNAQNLKQYCAETFESFFSGLMQEAANLETEIKSAIDSLRVRGYAFGKKAIERLEAERQAAAAESARLNALKKVKKPEPVSFWGHLWEMIINAFKSIGKAIAGLFGY